MSIMPLGDVRDHLSEIVHDVETTHERVTITKHGRPAVVLIAVDDLDCLEETLDLLSTPGAVEQIRQAEAEFERGEYAPAEEVLARYRSGEQ
jgi:prevent-host-death family protein